MKKRSVIFCILIISLAVMAGCTTGDETPISTTPEISQTEPAGENVETEQIDEEEVEIEEVEEETIEQAEEVDEFDVWWQEYKKSFTLDASAYPDFYRGAWGSRIDELRGYLINADSLRNAGFDSIMLGVDIVFDPDTGEAKSLGDDVFIFYIQALKKAGFRIVLIPNPMHPNLDMGKGYEWEEYDPEAAYHRSYELIKKLDSVVLKWAKIAEEYRVEGFVPSNEPYKLVRDYNDASRWLQEILPGIKNIYNGKVFALDTMHDTGQGMSIPYPYDYSGYDIILGGPPCGRRDIDSYETMMIGYVGKGVQYVVTYRLEGFGLYEWGGYTGGVWFEPIPEELVLSPEEAKETVEATVRQANSNTIASFPRVSTGWIDFDTPAFEALSSWHRIMGGNIIPPDNRNWTYEELIIIEERLAGEDYRDIFHID